MVDWIWQLCNMAFESDGVPEDWWSVMTAPLYKGKKERTECSNYRSITLSIIRAVQMDNLRGLLGIRRMDRILNAQIRESCLVTMWETID